MAGYYSEHHSSDSHRPRVVGSDFDEDALLNLLQSVGAVNPQSKPPASKAVIDTLPTTEITLEELAKETSCSVCLEPFPLGAHPTRLPCFHIYHRECVVEWLSRHNNCPTCRHELETDDIDYNENKRRERIENSSPPPSMYG